MKWVLLNSDACSTSNVTTQAGNIETNGIKHKMFCIGGGLAAVDINYGGD